MVEYRNVRESDLESISTITNRSRKGLPFWRDKSPSEIAAETFKDEDYDPACALLAFVGDEAVAYGEAFIDSGKVALGKKEGSIRVEVVPEHRGKGIEQELIARTERYLVGKGMILAQGVSSEKDVWRIALLESSRYRLVRRFYMMEMKTASLQTPLAPPQECRFDRKLMSDASEKDLDLFAQVFTDAFSEHFGYAPMPPNRMANFRDAAQDVFLLSYAYVDGACVGVCLTEDSVLLNRENGTKDGWIDVLGVRKAHRRRGIGTAMIVDGVEWLAGRGLDTVHIGVDAENPGALGLYESIGFNVQFQNIVYWKDIK